MTRLDRALRETIDEIDAALAADFPLEEVWSDAARAASAAARAARAKGGDWRNAARGAYHKSKAGRKASVDATVSAWKDSSSRADAKSARLHQRSTSRGGKAQTQGQARATRSLSRRGLDTKSHFGGARSVEPRFGTPAGERMLRARRSKGAGAAVAAAHGR